MRIETTEEFIFKQTNFDRGQSHSYKMSTNSRRGQSLLRKILSDYRGVM